MLTRLGDHVQRWANRAPWTNVIGLARTLLAACTLGTLLFSSTATLFRPAFGIPTAPFCDGVAAASLWCVPGITSSSGRLLAIVGLLVVASGWRPRLTALPHWWVTWSFSVSITIPDGGDQVAALLALMLLPLCLTDRRKWHWQTEASKADHEREQMRRLIGWSSIAAVRLQMAGIYLQASMAKLGVEEWADGTAIFYWMTDPAFGLPAWADGILLPVATSQAVVAITWGAVLLELVLFMALTMPRWVWPRLLALGIAFHVTIALLMGLTSFALAMAAGLIVYLRPADQPFRLPRVLRETGADRSPRLPTSPNQELHRATHT